MRKLHNVSDNNLRSDSPPGADSTTTASDHRAWQAAVSFRNRSAASLADFSSSFMISGANSGGSVTTAAGRQRLDAPFIAKVF